MNRWILVIGSPSICFYLQKKDMGWIGGRRILGLVLAIFVTACSIVEVGEVVKDEANGSWVAPGIVPPSMKKSVTFVSAFDYPEGYQWHFDRENGSVRCSLVVFMEESPVLKIPVGEEYRVSSDPDMHRIIDGHLYTFFSDEAETIVKKDGKPLFSYPQPEMITDIKVINGLVHTLGHPRSGEGFSYRVNGEVCLLREGGYAFERIMCQDTIASVAFVEPIRVDDGVLERYYIMRGGKVSQIAVREDIKKVWDVVLQEEQVFYLASLTGISMPVVVSEGEVSALSMPARASVIDCRINLLESGIGVEGVISEKSNLKEIIWNQDGNYEVFPSGMTVSAMCVSEDAAHFAMNPITGLQQGIIVRSGERLQMPEGYACMSRYAASFSSGLLSVGLSSLTGGKPVLWKDGDCVQLDVNGYIASVSSKEMED